MNQTGDIDLLAGRLFDRFRAPVGADVGEAGGCAGQQVGEEHRNTVAGIVFRCENERFADAVPVEGGVEDRFHKVAVGHEVRPLALSLETAGDGVVSAGFFYKAHFRELFVADHEVTADNGHLGEEFPDFILFLAGFSSLAVVDIFVFLAVFLDPVYRALVLFRIVNILLNAADDFALINRFAAHSEIFFEEIGVHNGARDTHGYTAHGEITLAAHIGNSKPGAHKAEDFFLDIFRNLGSVSGLYIPSVDTERRQALLRVSRQNRRQIYSTRAFRSIKSPYALDRHGIHIHRL